MKIVIVTPAPLNTTLGNRITAARWAGIIGAAGHQVTMANEWRDEECDLLIALHARKSHSSVERFHRRLPGRPLIVCLAGTDLYIDLQTSAEARHSVALATRLVVLQSRAVDELDVHARNKTSVIYQSAMAPVIKAFPAGNHFQVCVLGHLREVKDPMRTALAARSLPASSNIAVIHIGRSIEQEYEQAAKAEQQINPRYQWIGEASHERAMQILAGSRLMVLSSLAEGGSNAIAEAVVCGVPVLCSEIPGNIGMLDAGYPGYFPVNDTGALARLLLRAETESDFLFELAGHIKRLQPRFSPETEAASWHAILAGY